MGISKLRWLLKVITIVVILFLILYTLYKLNLIELKTLVTLVVVEMVAAMLYYKMDMLGRGKQAKKDHTNDLKKVIDQWIQEFPNVSTDKLQVIGFGILTGYNKGINPFTYPFIEGTYKNHELRLTIEDEYIFEDLLFHLEKQEPKISILWNEYKDKCIEQYKEGKELVLEIAKELTEQIGRETDTRQFRITGYGMEINSISERFINAIFHACIICVEGKNEEFLKFYEGFESRTGHKDNTIKYSISELETGFITIEKGLLKEDEFKTKMDNVMRQMFEKVKTDYYPKGKKLVNFTNEISILENRIKKLLNQQLSYQIFEGNCEYLN